MGDVGSYPTNRHIGMKSDLGRQEDIAFLPSVSWTGKDLTEVLVRSSCLRTKKVEFFLVHKSLLMILLLNHFVG